MIFFNTPEFKVGVLVVLIAGLIGVMSMKVAEGPGVIGGSKEHSFILGDASGLVKNSAVKMAGIKVGVIDDIVLEQGKARVKIVIDKEVPLTLSGKVEIRADGILGDKHVELVPGNPADPPLPPGAEIYSASDKGSMDKIMNEVGKITDSLGKLADTLSRAADGGDEQTTIGRILLNIEKVSKDLSDITGHNKGKIDEIVDQVHSITSTLDGFVNDDSPDGFKAGWQKAVDSLARIDTSLKNIEEITDKINRGEGTIGRLVNDEETVDELNAAIRNVNNFVGGAAEMETSIDFHSEYLTSIDDTKSYLSVKVQPGLDRYYELGIVDDPRGLVRSTSTTSTVNGGSPTTVDETKTFRNKIKFNALFAKNFYDFTVKGGIIENSGGVAFDYYLWRRRLRLSVEAFDFNDLYVRAYARYNLLKGVYLIGGGDNLLGEGDEPSTFFGAGIFITNDDLKTLASKVPL
ncbi:MAG: MCE family protein [Bdellovibrionaceae bacterium]|nr:MCE family protein [Bdellovibrionales bacterium]MCB9084743.1 MCE family protein [Pseudobdellovibrionaceae bacterium]